MSTLLRPTSTAVIAAVLVAFPIAAMAQDAGPASLPLTTASTQPSSAARSMVERVLVRVNGEIFSQGQLTQRQVEAIQDLNRDGAKLEASMAEVTPPLLVSAVDELLLVQRGREMGFKLYRRTVQERRSTTSNATTSSMTKV